MQVKKEQLEPTKVRLKITVNDDTLDQIKQEAVKQLGANVKVPGFRAGKAPQQLIEKQIDETSLQTQFLDQAVNRFYVDAVEQEKLRPVAQPNIVINKFVPYSLLEFNAEMDTVGEIKLADYKKIKQAPKKAEVTAKDINDVLENLRQRSAEKKDVTRPAKDGDELTIDFTGTDAKTGDSIAGADGKNYPLQLGSKTFIPGFEEELVGAKKGAITTFTLTFPKDYGAAELQNRKVSFAVTVHKVQELQLAKLDDAFAATIGPFKSVAELKADIKKQLTIERQQEADRTYDNELLEKIAGKSSVAIPDSLINEEMGRIEDEEKRNIAYRGQTWQEHLAAEGVTEEQHRQKQRPAAELRVKAGIILGDIAQQEHITVTPEELEVRVQLLKGQYTDPTMQAELEKPENRRDLMSRLMTEKTLTKLRSYATS